MSVGIGFGASAPRAWSIPSALPDAYWIDPVGAPGTITSVGDPVVSDWTTGTGWAGTGATGPYTHTGGGGAGDLTQAVGVVGNRVRVTYTIASRTAGTLTLKAGTTAGTARSTNATFVEELTVAGSTTITFAADDAFDGVLTIASVENISIAAIEPVQGMLNRCNDGRCEYAGTASWGINAGATLTKEADPYEGTQCLRCTGTLTNYGASKSLFTIGRQYRVAGYARSDGATIPAVFAGGLTQHWAGTTSTDWQRFDFVAVADGFNGFFIQLGTTAGYVEFDAIEIYDLDAPAGAVVQATATAQPWVDSTTGWVRFSGDAFPSNLLKGAFDFLHDGSPFAIGGTFVIDASSGTLIGNHNTLAQFGIRLLADTATGIVTVTIANGTGAAAVDVDTDASAIAAGTPFALVVDHEGVGDRLRIWVDGALVHTTAVTSGFVVGLPTYALTTGYDGAGNSLEGAWGEIVINPAALSAAEVVSLNAYLIARLP